MEHYTHVVGMPLTLSELTEMAQKGLIVWCIYDTKHKSARGALSMRYRESKKRQVPHIRVTDENGKRWELDTESLMEFGTKFYPLEQDKNRRG